MRASQLLAGKLPENFISTERNLGITFFAEAASTMKGDNVTKEQIVTVTMAGKQQAEIDTSSIADIDSMNQTPITAYEAMSRRCAHFQLDHGHKG